MRSVHPPSCTTLMRNADPPTGTTPMRSTHPPPCSSPSSGLPIHLLALPSWALVIHFPVPFSSGVPIHFPALNPRGMYTFTSPPCTTWMRSVHLMVQQGRWLLLMEVWERVVGTYQWGFVGHPYGGLKCHFSGTATLAPSCSDFWKTLIYLNLSNSLA